MIVPRRLAAIGLLSLMAAGAGACTRSAARSDDPPATVTATSVRVLPDSPILRQLRRERVKVADLPSDEIVAPGKIEANPNRVSKVVAPVAGRVANVMVRVGDAVAPGQPLFSLDSPDADAATSTELQAEAATSQTRAALDKARADADRTNDLYEHNAVARKEKLNADNAVAQAESALAQAAATLEQAKRRLAVLGLVPGSFKQQVIVRSPLAGKVLDLSIVQGEYRNDTSAAVVTIADLRTVWVASQVPETYIRFVRLKEKVEVRLIAYPGETFEAHVSRIADTVDPQTRTVKVQAEMDNPGGRFRPEMYGSIHHVERSVPTAVLPDGAILEEGGRSTVFVESSPGTFERRAVQLGKKSGQMVRVIRGVGGGETVVVDGAALLNNLMRRAA